MKNFYKVSNTIENGPRMDRKRTVVGPMKDRQWSRISPINHRLWTVIGPMLFVAFGLFGVNVEAWAGRVTGITAVESGKGSVYVKVERQRIYGWENANTGSTVDQDSSDPSKAEHSSAYAKHAVFIMVSSGTGYTFEGWYEEDGTYLSNSTSYTGPYVTSGADRTYKYFARFAPIQYNIAFNANYGAGGTGTGTTATVANVKYDRDTTLTLNGYSKIAYTVSYNANGGSGLAKSSDNSYYSFDKWTQNSNGTGTQYANGTTVSNLSATDKETVTLYAKWGTTASKIILPDAPSVAPVNKTFAGWFVDGDAKEKVVGIAGDEYAPTGNVTLKAKWTSVKIPGFKGSDQTLTVGETYNFGFSNTSTATPSSSSSANFYYVISDEVVNTDNTTGSLDGTKVISFSGNTVTALNKGTAKIKFYQKADAGNNIVAGESAEFTITVNKNEPTITWASSPYYYNDTIESFYSSSNNDTESSALSRNSNVASISGTTLITYNKEGSARIVVTQAENYKWAAKKDSILVIPVKKDKHVEFTIGAENNANIEVSKTTNVIWNSTGYYKLGTGNWGTSKPDDNVIISFEGIPDKLKFTTSCDPVEIAGTHYPSKKDYTFEVFESATNGGWISIWSNNNSADYSGADNVEIQLSATTRYVKLRYRGTCWGRYTNIRVTELKRFKTDSTSFDFKTNLKNAIVASKSFEFKHANAGYTVKAELSDSTHYQISLDNLSFSGSVIIPNTGGDRMDSSVVYVKYYPSATGDAEETHNATITFSDQLSNSAIVTLTGKTQAKLSTHLVYKGSASYSVDAANIAATDLFEVRDANNALVSNPTITLSAAANSFFDLANSNTELDPKCGGSATVTASYTGDETYAAASNLDQTITIARLADEISFENGKAVLVTGDEFDLEGWASALSGTDITYTTASTTVISVEDGKVKAIGKGTATLTATSAGDCTYNSGIAKLTIKVRNASDPCETALLYKSSKHNINLYSGTQTYTIKEGPQDKLTFKVWKTSSVATYSADVKILDNTDNVLHTYTYSVGDLSTTEPETPNVEIDITQYPTARKISISGSGTLYKYISELRVSQKAYLTASTSSVTMSTVKACETATGQFNISYSDLSTLHLTQTNENFSYEVWNGETKLDGFDNDCGDYGTYTVKFFYTPQVVGPYSNEVTISASGKSQTIVLNGTANKPDRTIVWDISSGNVISATQSVDLAAYAETSCLSPAGGVYYTYSSATEGAATIDGSKITFHKAATVTVTAHTSSSELYNDAPTVDKVWTVSKVGIVMETKPTITSTITCGDLSTAVTYDPNDFKAVSALDNTVVIPGTIAYAGPGNFNHAGLTDITFNFTPTDLSVYEATPFTVQVDVQHIASNATPSAEAITYGAAISSSTLSNSGTTAGTWTWNTENNDAVLDAGQHTLNVHFTPENSNYSELDATVTLKVNKAPTSLNWTNAPEDLAYNATGVTYTASSASDGTITYSIIAGGAYASIDGNGVLTIIEPGHTITIQASQAAGTNHTAPVAITVDVTIAAAPSAPTFNNVAGDNDWQNADNWSNGEVPSGENPDVIISGELIINEDVTVGGLTILPTGSVAVVTNGTLTIKGTSETRSEYGDMHVADDGNVVLGNSADLKVRHFFLDAKLGDSSTQAASGQVKGNGALNVIGDAYFQMKFDPSGAITYGWYDFVVPFEVNTNGGIYRVEANDDLTPMTSGVDFLVQSFSEARCAAGQKAWTNFSGTMMPGQGYTITFNYQPSFNQNTFLFKKKAGATIGGSNTYSAVRTFSGEESEQGWNVLGNGTLQHIELAENLKIQIFEHASNSYQPFEATEKTIAVGTSFQVQVFDAQKTIVMSTATDRPILAPKREVREVEEFRLSLTAEGEEKEADRLWISASEEATGAYWIGHDLLKKGTMTGAKVARMWCTRNGKQLCDVEMPMVNGSAENALGLFTPNAGQYTLAIEEAPADASLYLTYNGAVIWDLTASPYVFDLTKGTTEGYGLRIEAANAPQVTTGVENGGLMNDANSVRKVIIDNKMYIITPEGAIFDVIGKKVQ